MKAKRTNGAAAGRGAEGAGKVRVVAKANLPTQYGRFTILGVEGATPDETAVALVRGRLNSGSIPLVRIHSQCLTGDVLGSQRCACRAQLELSLRRIAAARAGSMARRTEASFSCASARSRAGSNAASREVKTAAAAAARVAGSGANRRRPPIAASTARRTALFTRTGRRARRDLSCRILELGISAHNLVL